jgi:Rrf2 family transcriptional regulator, cysteine metabolism repressor
LIEITDKSRSAVLALTELASRGDTGPVPILEVAERRAIPLHLLEQLFASLRRAGILQSQRGVKGGYSFRRAPAQVSLLEVVETVEGRLGPADDDGEVESGCDAVWREARDRVSDLLRDITIADIVEREERAQEAPMFHI